MGFFSSLRFKRQRAHNSGLVAQLIALRPLDTRRLTVADYIAAANVLGMENPADLHAFQIVESTGNGFGPQGRLIINYEKHVASRNTRPPHKYIKDFPEFYARRWEGTRNLPSGHPYLMDQAERWDLLARSADVDFEAALKGTSWGSWQILGENAERIGFQNVLEMVKYMYRGEHAQMDCAIRFLRAKDAIEDLQRGDMARVFAVYNGADNVPEYSRRHADARHRVRNLYA